MKSAVYGKDDGIIGLVGVAKDISSSEGVYQSAYTAAKTAMYFPLRVYSMLFRFFQRS